MSILDWTSWHDNVLINPNELSFVEEADRQALSQVDSGGMLKRLFLLKVHYALEEIKKAEPLDLKFYLRILRALLLERHSSLGYSATHEGFERMYFLGVVGKTALEILDSYDRLETLNKEEAEFLLYYVDTAIRKLFEVNSSLNKSVISAKLYWELTPLLNETHEVFKIIIKAIKASIEK